MTDIVQFRYGTWENFLNLENKTSNFFYFLDNSQVYRGNTLLATVHVVKPGWTSLMVLDDNGFPITPIASMRQNFYISLVSGDIKYVDDDLHYVNITELELESVLLNKAFLKRLINELADKKNIIMPTLTVNQLTLVWTGANVDSFTAYVPKPDN